MKKNKAMRLASVLLVLVLMTSSVVGGTFAKYTTTASGTDTARVAKWGVTITTTSNDLFGKTYKNDAAIGTTAVGAGLSVDSDDDAYVVAPGTSGSVEFSIAGTPEVAVDVDFVFTVTKDIKIPQNTTIAIDNTLSADYTPVVFTLKEKDATSAIATGTLSDIEEKFEDLSAEYAPNQTLDKTYVLSWEWAIGEGSAADTYLGNVAAGNITDSNTSTTINFDFTITATQID